ncbi:MAG TPA: hypothetical protein VHJ82_03410, partial [Actinomycetota bacterium]|nr:hypothetical protein [Actinomycetota bacterium]
MTTHSSDRIPTGIDDLDKVLGGLFTGDNVVWVSADSQLCGRVESLMLAARTNQRGIYVTATSPKATILRTFGRDIHVIDARAGSPLSDPVRLEQA